MPPEPLLFGPDDFACLAGAGPTAMADLHAFRALLTEWNQRMNLVGPSALDAFWLRHAYDSAQLLALAPQAQVWADLGAGAGFPGLVLAILFKARGVGRVHLVESMAKRCIFLREVVATLDLPAEVHHRRAEETRIAGVQIVTARACAPLARLLEFAWPILGQTRTSAPVGLFLKGKDAPQELTEAARMWDFHADLTPSLSDPSGRIVRIERLRRAKA
jgi:16S rRNA (guanine527-N7)-methyltransferase